MKRKHTILWLISCALLAMIEKAEIVNKNSGS